MDEADPQTVKSVTIPLLNPNEPEALLTALHIHEGQHIRAGDLLATLETTKSTAELAAEQEGFVAGLHQEQGATVRAGEILCYITPDPDWSPPVEVDEPASEAKGAGVRSAAEDTGAPAGTRITKPALALARQLGVELDRLPRDRLITESAVRAFHEQTFGATKSPTQPGAFDPLAVILYGGGGHGKTLIELLMALHTYRIVGIIDDGLPPGTEILGIRVLGDGSLLPELYQQGVRLAVNSVGGIGNLSIRVHVFRTLIEAGYACPAVIHPTAWVENSARLSPGVQVFAHAYIGSEARVGFGCIVNTGAIISHDCWLDEYSNMSPGAILAGEVRIGSGSLIGMGATVNLQVTIGAGARIGNNATVKEDVPERGVVRAGSIWR